MGGLRSGRREGGGCSRESRWGDSGFLVRGGAFVSLGWFPLGPDMD